MMWVTDSGFMNDRLPNLQFRFHAAMTGALGIGANLLNWSDEDRAKVRAWIAAYKEIRETVKHGLLYRLRSPERARLQARLDVSGQRAAMRVVVLVFPTQFAFSSMVDSNYPPSRFGAGCSLFSWR